MKNDERINNFREVDVTYIFGLTGVGKTRYVFEKHGYSNTFKVTNYSYYPFDGINERHTVLLLDEFDSSLPIKSMNDYMDGYPILLPARFYHRPAFYTKVYIVSNLPLTEQYKNIQLEKPKVWEAFLDRIHEVYYMDINGLHKLKHNSGRAILRAAQREIEELIKTVDETLPTKTTDEILKDFGVTMIKTKTQSKKSTPQKLKTVKKKGDNDNARKADNADT